MRIKKNMRTSVRALFVELRSVKKYPYRVDFINCTTIGRAIQLVLWDEDE